MRNITASFEADEALAFKERWAKRVTEYPLLGELFSPNWVWEKLLSGFPQGYHPVVELLIAGESVEPISATMEKALELIWSDNECVIRDKAELLKASNDYPEMRQVFLSTITEIYVLAHLRSSGYCCSLRPGIGADINVVIDGAEVNIEVTTRFSSHLDEELRSTLLMGLPRKIREGYYTEILGSFNAREELHDAIRYLFWRLSFGEYEYDFEEDLGPVQIKFIKTEDSGIGSSTNKTVSTNVIDYDISLKLANKASNLNQTGSGRPVLVLVNISTLDGSHYPVIYGNYSYPSDKIPKKIDGVIAYWLTLDNVRPWKSSLTLHPAHDYLVEQLIGAF